MKQILMPSLAWLAAVVIMVICCSVTTSHAAVVKVKVQDIAGKPSAGVKIFFYQGLNVRKPADFISAPSDDKGQVVVTIPAGKYWAVARLKKDSLYGPLMSGDKHSGEPVEIECSDTLDTDVLFEVADIREIGERKRTGNPGTIKLWGRVLDKDGNPVAGAYIFAGRTRELETVPEFLSVWTDESGNYTLYLPSKGRFYVGGTSEFPPSTKSSMLREVATESQRLDVATDIQIIVY